MKPRDLFRIRRMMQREVDSIPASSGGGMFVKDEGVDETGTLDSGAFDTLDFVGAGVSVSASGSTATVNVPAAFPVGAVYINVTGVNPATELGYGTWSAFGAGRVLVGYNSGDADFDTAEETGGAKTVAAAGTVSAPTISGNTGSATTGITVSNHADHTHNYTQVPNHVHVQRLQGGTTGATTGTNIMGSTATGGSLRSSAQSTLDPTGGVATAVTLGSNTTLTHTVNDSGHTHGAGTLAASAPTFTGSATSVVQPYIVVHFWKRTA